MAAVTAPANVGAQHQSLLHFVGEASWSDERVSTRDGVAGNRAPWADRCVDHRRHGFSQEGRHSVGVARQYCGQLGKRDNCQVAVSLSIANHYASLPVAYRLYLPKDWAKDRARRRKAGVPKEISFKTKPQIALEQLRWACEAALPRGVALLDAGYGANTDLRANITTLGLWYVAGIMPNTTVWAPGTAPLPPKKWSGRGRPPKLIRRDAKHRPRSRPSVVRLESFCEFSRTQPGHCMPVQIVVQAGSASLYTAVSSASSVTSEISSASAWLTASSFMTWISIICAAFFPRFQHSTPVVVWQLTFFVVAGAAAQTTT